jgi:diphthamide synthase (EF-2-diphthine--ammonia ligase)
MAFFTNAILFITDELDSFMYQSVGHHAIDLYAEAMVLPLYRREISGTSKSTDRDYQPTVEDEVEDLYELLKTVKVVSPIYIEIFICLRCVCTERPKKK